MCPEPSVSGSVARSRSAKTPRNRGIFCDAPRCDLKVSATADWVAERVKFELSVGELKANPNRPTWQQRQTRAAASSGPGTRCLRFGFARTLAQNPATPRGFWGQKRAPAYQTPETQTEWRSEWNSNFQYSLWGRIGSESEPPKLATEINATSCPLSARNSPSPVRIRLCPSSKTPRKRGSFWDGRG